MEPRGRVELPAGNGGKVVRGPLEVIDTEPGDALVPDGPVGGTIEVELTSEKGAELVAPYGDDDGLVPGLNDIGFVPGAWELPLGLLVNVEFGSG